MGKGDSMNFYTVLHDNTSIITDLSLKVKDYTANPVGLELGDTHHLYVGYYKPFKQFFIELSVANTNANNLAFEYWNGSAWTTLEVIDESEGFTKSGFVVFVRPNDWAENTVNGDANFYIRIQPSVSHSVGTIVDGLGVLFSNDLDLIGIKENIVSKLNSGDSWVGKHEAARKYIIQKLRNGGHRKVTTTDPANNPLVVESSKASALHFSDLTEFDLHEPFELREAAKFYALSFIYLDELSDEQDDKWERSGRRHEERADEAVNVFMLKLDTNDNGKEDESESNGSTRINLSWQ
jgi:hypothetical protein